MSFEDDEYWEEQYSDHYGVASAVARDRYPESYSPEPFPRDSGRDDGRPRPMVRTSTWDGEIGPGPDQPDIDLDAPPPDELAARRRRRSASGRPSRPAPPRASGGGFDNARPGWLDDPDFVPTDVSGPNLAGPDSDVLDFNRPELGANFDNPEFIAPAAARPRRTAPKSGPDFSDPDFVHGYGDGYDDAQYAADLAREAARYAEPREGGRVDARDGGRVEFDGGGFADDRGGFADERGGVAGDRGGFGGDRAGFADDRGGLADDRAGFADDRAGFADDRGGFADGRGRGYAGDRGRAEVRGYAGERDYQRSDDPRYNDDPRYRDDRATDQGERGRPRRGGPAPDRGQVRPIRADRSRVSVDGVDDGPISGARRSDLQRQEQARSEAARLEAARAEAARLEAARLEAARAEAARSEAARAGAARVEDQRGPDITPADDLGDGPIRPPGGRRGRRNAGPQGRPARRDERQLPPVASGRARVPVPPMAEPEPDDALDLYRPSRDGEAPREPAAFAPPNQPQRDEPRTPAAFTPPTQTPHGEPRNPAAFTPPQQPQRDEPRAPAAFTPPTQPAGTRPDTDTSQTPGDETPRVVRKEAPPTTPRVISKAAPPATPKIIKKADPPATPRVIKVEPPAAPARVIPAAPPARPDVPAASRPAPPAPAPSPEAPNHPATAPPTEAHHPNRPDAEAHRPDGPNRPATETHRPDDSNRPAAGVPAPDGTMAAPPAAYRPGPETAAPAKDGAGPSWPAAGPGGPELAGSTDDQRFRAGDQRPNADPIVPQSPAGGPPSRRTPAGPRAEDLRPAPLPHVPGPSPERSVAEPPDLQRRAEAAAFFGPATDAWPATDDARPAWAGDTPVAGSPRVRPALPDRQPHARPPVTPPPVTQRPEPMPINGSVPRRVDAPAPRPAGHRATPDPQSFATPGNPAAQRPDAVPQMPAPNAARHSAAMDRTAGEPATDSPAWQRATDENPALGSPAWQRATDENSPAWQRATDENSPAWQRATDENPALNSPAGHRPAQSPPAPVSPAGRHGEADAQAVGFLADRRPSAPPAAPSHRADEVPVAGTSPAAPASADPSPRASTGTHAEPRPAPQPANPDNPVPIGKLATSGPDTTKRRYADADLGATWFTAKTPAAPATDPAAGNGAADSSPTPQPNGPAAQPNGNGAAPATADSQHAEPMPHAGHSETVGSGDGSGVDVGPTRPLPRQATPAEAAPGDQAGVVIDLDITGLINGLGMTSEHPVIATGTNGTTPSARDRTTANDPAAVNADDQVTNSPDADVRDADGTTPGETGHAEMGAAGQRAVQPGPATDESESAVRPLKPLSAEDLEAIRWRLDGGTLREVVDDREALRDLAGRLDEPLAEEQDNVTRSGLLSVRAEVYRLMGELGLAAAASRLALAHAEAAGDVQSVVIAQAELAHVLRLRGDFAEADRLFEEAASSESPEVLRSVVHENAGRCCFDQGRHMEALDHFARAIRLGAPDDLDLVERIGVCLEAVYIHVLRDGWGPYPRLRREILGPVRGPHPAPDAAPTASRGSTLG